MTDDTHGDCDTGDGRPRLAQLRDVETVYQPAEDSRLLAETATDHGVGSGDLVLDVGTGSGYVAARVREETGARVVGTDISPDACRQASEAGVSVVRANLVAPFRDEQFDIVVCNPPYLPTPPDQEWDDPMERALSGGEDGRAMVDPFLAAVGRVLAPGGQVYLLISTLTGPDAVRETARAAGFETDVVATESQPFERLLVLELTAAA
jgi:release factor glutamine methyltransferase